MLATVHNDIPRNYDLSDFRIVSLFSSYALTLLDGHCWDALVYSNFTLWSDMYYSWLPQSNRALETRLHVLPLHGHI